MSPRRPIFGGQLTQNLPWSTQIRMQCFRSTLCRTVDIERKKQDLRVMVGERYRDLIDAADAIQSMSKAASAVDATFSAMGDGCDAQVLRKRVAMGNLTDDENAGVETERIEVYSVAAQIKVLVDTPEQIWHALEDNAHLKACRLYLVAKQVHENVTHAEDMAALRPMYSFPVVKRQWNTVSHFRGQIVERSVNFLGSVRETPQSTTGTLCAVMLLTDCSQRHAMERLLFARRTTLVSCVKPPAPETPAEIIARICMLLDFARKTLEDVQSIFTSSTSSEPPLLETTMRQLTQVDVTGSTTIADLYKEKTNLHVIYRHLPPSIASHRPQANDERHRSLPPDAIRDAVASWIQAVREVMVVSVTSWLSGVQRAATLASIWKQVLLHTSQRETGTVQKHWRQLCLDLFKKPFSLWTDVFRAPFNDAAEAVIRSSFRPLSNQPNQLIGTLLRSRGDMSTVVIDRHMAEYVWSTDNFAAGSINLEDTADIVYRGETPALAKLGAAFESILKDVTDDASALFQKSVPDPDDAFRSTTDSERIFHAFSTILAAAVTDYREGLMSLLRSRAESIVKTDDENAEKALQIDACLFVGRVGRSVALRLRRLSATPGIAAKLISLEQLLLEVYHAAHDIWIDVIADRLRGVVAAQADRSAWAQKDYMLSWEGGLPAQPSPYVIVTLFDLCREWNRVAGFTLEKTALLRLMARTHHSLAGLYSALMPDAPDPDAATQLAFDYAYFSAVLSPEEAVQLMDEIRLPEVSRKSIKDFWRGTGTLFGSFLIAHGIDTPVSTTKAVTENYNIIPLAAPPPRFTPLPVPATVNRFSTASNQQAASATTLRVTDSGCSSTHQGLVGPTPAHRRVSLIPDPLPQSSRPPVPEKNRPSKPPALRLRPGQRGPPQPSQQASISASRTQIHLPGQGLGKTIESLTSGARNVFSGVLDYTSQVGSPVMGRKRPGGS
ncbi:Golgi transport complex subunit 1 [Thoreauomyces humboldtii]|nr:Golgi transport complex subunit 1 [Thoreauomyces humboldtii]